MTDKEHLDAALERLSKAVRELHEVKEGRDRLHHYWQESIKAGLDFSDSIRKVLGVSAGADLLACIKDLRSSYVEALDSLAKIKSAIIQHLDPYAGDTCANAVKAAGETLEKQAKRIDGLCKELRAFKAAVREALPRPITPGCELAEVRQLANAHADIVECIREKLGSEKGELYTAAIARAAARLESQAALIAGLRDEIDDLKERNDNQAEMIDAIASERDEAEEELAALKENDSGLATHLRRMIDSAKKNVGCPPSWRIDDFTRDLTDKHKAEVARLNKYLDEVNGELLQLKQQGFEAVYVPVGQRIAEIRYEPV